ncbi:hypothetical protein LXL04_024828 [Taraxacum kok-saghyz]
MTGEKEKEKAGSSFENSPVVIHSEGVINAGIILTESNYDVWSQLMEMHLAEREKLSYIRGKTTPLDETDARYEKWYADNQKVKRWLLMSMKPEIMKRYLRLSTAHEIWIALSKAFYDGSDELQVFTLNQKAYTSKQNGKSLSEYYGELTTIFLELDHCDKVVMKYPDDVKAYRKAIDRLRVHIFLAGLDTMFEQINGEIQRKDPIPELEECYALIRREGTRHATLMNDVGNLGVSVMKTNFVDKSSLKCTQCNKTGHTKTSCFEFVGYIDWWDHNREPKKKNFKKPPMAAVAEGNQTSATTRNAGSHNGM